MSATIGNVGQRGFDANHVISREDADAFVAHGYTFALRYIRRAQAASNDLSAGEVADLHAAGLAVGIVQHFGPREGWIPTDGLGAQYGTTAAIACEALNVPPGVTVWLDLEGIAEGTDAEQIIRYCNDWYAAVANKGFQPGVYVGDANGLTPDQLYSLRFRRYFAAYNLNLDQYPATCGVCMRQHAATAADKPAGIPYEIDTDTIVGDQLGRFPTLWSGV